MHTTSLSRMSYDAAVFDLAAVALWSIPPPRLATRGLCVCFTSRPLVYVRCVVVWILKNESACLACKRCYPMISVLPDANSACDDGVVKLEGSEQL